MASLEKRGSRYRLVFRHGGQKYQHPLGTTDPHEADACLKRLEEGIRLLERGRLDPPPPGADLPVYLLSDGKLNAKPQVARSNDLTLSELFALYRETLTEGAKAATTLATERTHVKNLLAVLKPATPVEGLTKVDVQAYADRRARRVRPATVKKEVATLGFIWRWGVERGHVRAAVPSLTLTYRKQSEKEPFRTWAEIEAIVKAGGLDADQEADLWESLFLDERRIGQVLEYVRRNSRHAFLYPMLVFAAYTGARRSEIVASQTGDVDLDERVLRIREKKRKKSAGGSFRQVPLHSTLVEVLREWYARHPGGRFTFCREPNVALTWNAARKYLRRALDGGEWAKIGGWHTFRHSFASNCARRGIPQSHIDAWMGHQTEAMRDRYRHQFPQDLLLSIERLFSSNK